MKVALDRSTTFSNVYLFIADALRFDSFPDRLDKYGNRIKTVASGLQTPSAFGSILTGRYPNHHGIYHHDDGFREEIPSVFDFTSNTIPFYCSPLPFQETKNVKYENKYENWVREISGLTESFVVLDRDLFPHAPYNQEYEGTADFDSVNEYCKDRKGDFGRVHEDYQSGINKMTERFEYKLEILEDKNVLEDTLVIFTADHGEMLGEHGLFGHGNWTCPETVYVPTVFCNDSLEATGEIMGQIDLFPTIASLLGIQLPRDPYRTGVNLTNERSEDRIFFNLATRKEAEWSVWGKSGGYVFSNRSLIDCLYFYGSMMAQSGYRSLHQRRPLRILKTCLTRDRTMGSPEFSREDAKKNFEDIYEDRVERQSHDLDERTKERLERLGYLEN